MPNFPVICCFCGKKLDENLFVEIAIKILPAADGIQELYSHRECLDKVLYKDIPRHPDLENK